MRIKNAKRMGRTARVSQLSGLNPIDENETIGHDEGAGECPQASCRHRLTLAKRATSMEHGTDATMETSKRKRGTSWNDAVRAGPWTKPRPRESYADKPSHSGDPGLSSPAGDRPHIHGRAGLHLLRRSNRGVPGIIHLRDGENLQRMLAIGDRLLTQDMLGAAPIDSPNPAPDRQTESDADRT